MQKRKILIPSLPLKNSVYIYIYIYTVILKNHSISTETLNFSLSSYTTMHEFQE